MKYSLIKINILVESKTAISKIFKIHVFNRANKLVNRLFYFSSCIFFSLCPPITEMQILVDTWLPCLRVNEMQHS